jgi:type IV secretion system protein VirB9
MSARGLLLAGVALACLTGSAIAAEVPAPCSKADARERCVAYRQGQIVRVYLAPGASITMEFPASEVIYEVLASDNGIISGQPASDRTATGSDKTSDPNLQVQVPENSQFLAVKALHHLDPQPFTVITKRTVTVTDPTTGKTATKEELRRHGFEIETRPGALTEDVPDTFFSVRITDPAAERDARMASRRINRAKDEANIATERLQTVSLAAARRNERYVAQGTAKDRVLTPDEMWDDGQNTYLRFRGNRAIPAIWQVMPDGKEGAISNQPPEIDPVTHGTLISINGVYKELRLRSEGVVLCVFNQAYDPVGVNPGTGTVSPGVIRETKAVPHG